MNKIVLVILIGMSGTAFGQKISPSVIANAGAVMKAANFSLEWTLGEVITETKTSPTLIVTQGFHQANLGITRVNDLISKTDVELYPNPVNTVLNVKNKSYKDLEFILLNVEGKEILKGKLPIGIKEIDMEHFSSGLYLLNVQDKNFKQTFNIEKIN